MSNLGQRLVAIALRDIGVSEALGAIASPDILAMASSLRLASYQRDETPWCGLAMGYWTDQLGLERPATFLSARGWLSWGVQANEPELGDVTVLWRGTPAGWEGHVGLFIARRGSQVWLLGGNQGNSVCIVPFPVARVLAYRRAPASS